MSKIVSVKRLRDANQQIANLNDELQVSREYSSVVAAELSEKVGLIKHLKTTNNKLRVKIATLEGDVKELNTQVESVVNDLGNCRHLYNLANKELRRVITERDEIATAASVSADNRDFYKEQLGISDAHNVELQRELSAAEKDATCWRRACFGLALLTIISEVLNYVVG